MSAKPFRAIIVIGPTASGKTALAHGLADAWRRLDVGSELVNLDAFQFYRGLSVGTAKPTVDEITKYKYHCVDILEVPDRIDAAEYARRASMACTEICAQGGVPVCVGGSGLYLRAFLHGLDELPQEDEGIRLFLRRRAGEIGWPALHGWLEALDPDRAKELHPNDGVRIERAIEIFFLTGKKPSDSYKRASPLREQDMLFDAFVVHVDVPDAMLRERIELRTKQMLDLGWVDEVRLLKERFGDALSSFQCMKAIGYRNVLDCVNGGSELAALASVVSIKTWQYARRQRTWNAKEVRHAGFEAGGDLSCVFEAAKRWWYENK
jgi:tRNA dimethylallyltransferase